MLSTLFLLCAVSTASAEEPSFVVIVHPETAVDAVSQQELSRLFVGKTRRWRDGTAVHPVDLADETLREAACLFVHGKSVSAIDAFWQRQLFAGRGVPPPKMEIADVVRHVRATRGAIAVIPSSRVEEGVKTIRITRDH